MNTRFTRPIHRHDCPSCVYVGSWEQIVPMYSEEKGYYDEVVAYDGYLCLKWNRGLRRFEGSVIARDGYDGDYHSQRWEHPHSFPCMDRVRELAVENGIVEPDGSLGVEEPVDLPGTAYMVKDEMGGSPYAVFRSRALAEQWIAANSDKDWWELKIETIPLDTKLSLSELVDERLDHMFEWADA